MSGGGTGRPKFTPQQELAIRTRDVSVGLSAGAGCGKTFVLTQRFLSHLEPGPGACDMQQLVAITFTDKAAREMRDRIRAACQQRLANCGLDEIDHWLKILRGLDSARISTIHSFCTGLLRSHAVEAGLDPRFGLLEPALADTLLQNVVRDVVHGLLERDDEDVCRLVLVFGLEKTRTLLEGLTRDRFRIEFGRFEGATPESIAGEWLRRWRTELVPELVGRLQESSATQRLLELLSRNEPTHATMQERRRVLLDWLQRPHGEWSGYELALTEIVENARVQGGGTVRNWPDAEAYEAIKEGLGSLRDAAKKLSGLLEPATEDLALAAEFCCRGLRVLRQVVEAYERVKQEQGLLDFDDLLLRARNLLRSEPQVSERIGSGIRLLMVDEFQDTDPVQAEIVRQICGAALISGRLFLVGDHKQSIYRFRRADPEVFRALREQIPESGRLPLNRNFRSQPEVLKFVNHVFSSALGDQYEPLEPFDKTQYSPAPTIEFLWATYDAPDASGRPDGADEPDDRAPARRRREADWIARRIRQMLDDPTLRVRDKQAGGRLRRVQPGDVVLLFRALTNVQEYEAALRRYGIDYYLVGGKAFFSQQEVYDLLNLCRYLADPDDAVGLAGVLRSPFFNLSDDALQAMHRPGLAWHEALLEAPPEFLPEDQRQRWRFAAEVLQELRARKDHVPLSELLQSAIDRTAYDAALMLEHLGSRKVANLRKLIELAREFEGSEQFTFQDFVQRLQSSVLQETDEEFATTLPETGNVVRLMSVHQSKGLEFPVVVAADMNRRSRGSAGSAVLHAELGALLHLPPAFGVERSNLGLIIYRKLEETAEEAETLRVMYVALTRAADMLICSAAMEPALTPESTWLKTLASRFHLDTGLPKFDPLLGASAGATADPDSIPHVHVHREPPAATPVEAADGRGVSLQRLAEAVLAATPTDPPDSAKSYAPDRTAARYFSVSQLEGEVSGEPQFAGVVPERDEPDVAGWDRDRATLVGTLFHAVMERIDVRQPEMWRTAFEAVCRRESKAISDDDGRLVGELVDCWRLSPMAEELRQSERLFRELEFVLPVPGGGVPPQLVVGQIDCLLKASDGWRILDYKTGSAPAAKSDAEILAPYAFQLGVYALAAEAWLEEPLAEAGLILLRPAYRRIVLPWDEEARQTVRGQLAAAIKAAVR